MTNQNQEPTNQAQVNITYYFGPGDSPPYLLSKKYVVKNWQDEAHLRQILDELASQLNHISGYGILSIDVAGKGLKFKVDYKERIKPFELDTHEYNLGFDEILRFEVGSKTGWQRGPVRLEILAFVTSLHTMNRLRNINLAILCLTSELGP